MSNLSHAEVARIKAFMSRTTDRFRPPYGMRLVESPRQCVFAGTVNHSSYLRDERQSQGRRRPNRSFHGNLATGASVSAALALKPEGLAPPALP